MENGSCSLTLNRVGRVPLKYCFMPGQEYVRWLGVADQPLAN
jgi:hypothetical protein